MPVYIVFLNTFFSAFGFLSVLSFLVIIHELGHLLTALAAGISVEEFGIGYPPRAKTLFKWKNIPFTLNWLPFGGFVKMVGEDGPSEEDKEKKVVPFYTKSKRIRLLVLTAGVFMNFVFGLLAFSTVYAVTGFPRVVNDRIVGEVVADAPAAQAGMQPKDKILAALDPKSADLGKKQFTSMPEFIAYVEEHSGQKITVFVDRDGKELSFEVYLRTKDERPADQGSLGIAFEPAEVVYDFYPWWQTPFRAAYVGMMESLAFSLMVLQGLGAMVGGLIFHAAVPKDVSGPLGIVHEATKVGLFQSGWDNILRFAGVLSINLAVLNLLPIPALDGGRAFFVLLESVIGKTLREKIENKVNYVGFAFLLGLIILISVKDAWGIVHDVVKYFRG